MNSKKTVLILTDEAESTSKMAEEIANTLDAHNPKVKSASSFEGTDLLAAELFFIGCENTDPPSFSYIKKMLDHINLAGRTCGIFGKDDAGINYLAGILKDCGAAVKCLQDKSKIRLWAQEIAA